jgi:hypothetical protein
VQFSSFDKTFVTNEICTTRRRGVNTIPTSNFSDPGPDARDDTKSTVFHREGPERERKEQNRTGSMGHHCITTTLVARIDTKNRTEHRPEMGRSKVFVTCQVFLCVLRSCKRNSSQKPRTLSIWLAWRRFGNETPSPFTNASSICARSAYVGYGIDIRHLILTIEYHRWQLWQEHIIILPTALALGKMANIASARLSWCSSQIPCSGCNTHRARGLHGVNSPLCDGSER